MVDNSIFRCRRCRHVLFSSENVLTEHGFHMFKCDGDTTTSTTDEICDRSTVERQSQWFISIDDNSPHWIQKSLEVNTITQDRWSVMTVASQNTGHKITEIIVTRMQEKWLKGKLNCPKCKGRVGSFDFITSSRCPCGQFTQPAVHILCSRVDHNKALTPQVLPGLVVPSIDKVAGSSTGCDRRSRIQENLSSHCAVDNQHGDRTSKSDSDVVRKRMGKLNFGLSNNNKVYKDNKGCESDTGYRHGYRVHSPELASMTSALRYQGSVNVSEGFAAEELVGNLHTLNIDPSRDTENRYNFHRDTRRSYPSLSEDGPRSYEEVTSSSVPSRNDILENLEEKRGFGLENKRRSKRRKRISRKLHEQEDFRSSGSHDVQNRFSVLETASNIAQKSGTDNGNMQIEAILVDEREEMPVSDEHLCPVCLDLYCKPLLCYPCQHTFCEPCLRRLARAKPINTVCPLCRKTITECHKNNELEITLKELYRYKYTERSRSERRFCSDRFYPLPRGHLHAEILEQDGIRQVSRKTWITVLLVVMGISIVCFRPVVVNFLSVVDAIVTVISILDLVNLF